MKTRNKMKKLEQEKFVIPKTVQNVIPIKAVYKDGIFLVGKNMYSKTFLFTDVNYYIACENEKNDLMRQYWAVINSFGNGVTVKLTINNHRFDKEDFEKSILMPYYYDNLDVYRKEYNEMLLNKAATSECIVQDKYFTVTVNKTYIFIDEMYLLFAHQYTAKFLYRIWKRVRKYGAFAIGITQNVGDMLESNTARTMVSNSEFVIMLNQKASDVLELSRLLEITPNQTQYFTNKDAGQGLMKIGSNLVPFVNKFPKDTQLYKLMTSKPGEAI